MTRYFVRWVGGAANGLYLGDDVPFARSAYDSSARAFTSWEEAEAWVKECGLEQEVVVEPLADASRSTIDALPESAHERIGPASGRLLAAKPVKKP